MLFCFEEISNQVIKGLMWGIVMFYVYINHLEMGVNNMLMKFADDTKLEGAVSMHNDKMDKWFRRNMCKQKMTFDLKMGLIHGDK